MILTKKQSIALDYLEDGITTELYYGGAAGGGKSILGCFWLIKSCLKYPGSRWLMGRSELKNLKKTTLNTFFEVARKQGVKLGKHFRYNPQDAIIRFSNGSEIVMADLFDYPSDPEFDSLGSLEITGAFIDEASQITEKAKNIVKSRIRYMLTECGLIPKMLMCGNPSKNWSYYEFYQPSMSMRLREDRKFVQALPGDNHHLPESYISSLRGLDTQSKARLLEGSWEYDSDPAALIEYDKILLCFEKRELPKKEYEDEYWTDGVIQKWNYNNPDSYYITADIARFGKDKTVIVLWYDWQAKIYAYHGLSITQSAEKIQQLQKLYNVPDANILVDEDGLGGGCVDILKCYGFVNNSRPKEDPNTREPENYVNLKSQCYFRFAEEVNNGYVYIECDDIKMKADIIQELEQVKQYRMDRDGKKAVIPKEKVKELIGRSPDYSDALMMRVWFEITPRMTWCAF